MASVEYFELLRLVNELGEDNPRVQELGREIWGDIPTGQEPEVYLIFDAQGKIAKRGTVKEITRDYRIGHATIRRSKEGAYINRGQYKDFYIISEKEIKDYDEKYWAFRVPVEVVE